MNRILALALSLFIVGSSHAQTCVGQGGLHFLWQGGGDDVPLFESCATLGQSQDLIACSIDAIAFETSGISSAKNMIIDITAPGTNCAIRFVNQSLLDASGTGPYLGACNNACDTIVPWVGDAPTFALDASIFNDLGISLTGEWRIELSYTLFDLDFNAIGAFVLGDCTGCGTPGCTDPSACNFDSSASFDDGTCVYLDLVDCSGQCVNDADGDGVCDENEILGCMEPNACNFDADATDDNGSCLVNDNCGVCGGNGSTCTTCSQALSFDVDALAGGESAGLADSLGLFPGNGTVDSIAVSLDFVNVSGDGSWPSDMMLFIYPPNNPCYYVGGYNVPSNCVELGSWPPLVTGWNNTLSGNYTTTISLESLNVTGSGAWSFEVVNGWPASGGAGYSGSIDLYGVCPPSDSELIGCTNPTACNFNPFAVQDDGSCYLCGCIYPDACNFNPLALEDDGSCEYTSCGGCTYPNACNFNPLAGVDDGSCLYPADLGVCDCAGSIEDALGICGGSCDADQDNDGICDDIDDCVGTLDACGVCNGPGAIYACGCADLDEGACDCLGTPCGTVTEVLEVENPFLDLPYVQGATPFISVYEGWFDADFITVGIYQVGVNLNGGGAQNAYEISIAHGTADAFATTTIPVQAGVQFASEYVLDLSPFGFTAADILAVQLADNSGTTLDRLFVSGVPLSQVSIGDVTMAPGQHRLVRQPWVLQGRLNLEEEEWLVCDENEAVPFYSAWDLEPTILVPLNPGSNDCLNDSDGDGVCDQLELPVYCQNVNATNYSPLQNTLICDDAETLEFWMSSFTLDQGGQLGTLTPASPLGSPQAMSAMASNSCSAGASQLAFCNTGQRAFVVDENNKSVRIVDYGNLNNPALISDGTGNGIMDIRALEISTELTAAGVADWGSLVPLDVDIYNTIVGPDDTTYCCSLMVAVAWVDTASLANPGWISFHDSNGALLGGGANDIYPVGPSPRSLSFSEDGSWLVVACAGEGEYAVTDPKGEVVCVNVAPFTQSGDLSTVTSYAFPLDHDGALTMGGGLSRTDAGVYGGGNAALAYQLEPSHVAITPDESRAYVNCQVNNAIVQVNLDSVITPGTGVIAGVYGYGTRDMSATGFDGKDDGSAIVETSTEDVLAWYQPGDIEIISDGTTTLLLTANEGKPSVDGSGADDIIASTSAEFNGLLIDSEYGFGATGIPSQPSYVYGARSFSIWNITAGGAPTMLYDSGPTMEQTLATLMPDYANSTEKDYNSGDEASISRGPQPSGIAHGLVANKDVVIVSLEQMGGSMIFNINPWLDPAFVSANYQAYATNRDFQNPSMNQCNFNHLGAEDVYFLPSQVTGYTGVTGVNEGYDAILVSNDESGSLTLFSLESNLDIPGCTDSCACNYNSNATMNDGSCDFSSCAGCTYPEAANYDSSSLIEDGTCEFTNDCPADLNNDGSVNTTDLLEFLAAFGLVCP